MDNKDLTQWIAAQRNASAGGLGRYDSPAELHLHQHTHPAPQAASEPAYGRPHPLVVAMAMLVFSVAISLPLALLAAIVDYSNRPSVQYIEPSRGGW